MPVTNYRTVNGRIISQNKNGVYTRLLSDPLGNVIATVDASGVKTNDTTYWPYGEVRTGGVSSVTSLGFCGAWGYYTDASARLYVRARYYRPVLGRWQTVDPLWPREKAYGYVRSRPVLLRDPSGYAPWDKCGFAQWTIGSCLPGNFTNKCLMKCLSKGSWPIGCAKFPFTCEYWCECYPMDNRPPCFHGGSPIVGVPPFTGVPPGEDCFDSCFENMAGYCSQYTDPKQVMACIAWAAIFCGVVCAWEGGDD